MFEGYGVWSAVLVRASPVVGIKKVPPNAIGPGVAPCYCIDFDANYNYWLFEDPAGHMSWMESFDGELSCCIARYPFVNCLFAPYVPRQ